MRVMRMHGTLVITILEQIPIAKSPTWRDVLRFQFFTSANAHGNPCFAKGKPMSAYQKSMPWFRRPARSLIAAPAARLLAGHKRERRIPHDPREMERFRMELELKRASLDLTYRFKVM
jgi:hypothetical protein